MPSWSLKRGTPKCSSIAMTRVRERGRGLGARSWSYKQGRQDRHIEAPGDAANCIDNPVRPQAIRRMRSISLVATPYTSATWAAVIQYFTPARMRANCAAGMTGVTGGLALTGASGS